MRRSSTRLVIYYVHARLCFCSKQRHHLALYRQWLVPLLGICWYFSLIGQVSPPPPPPPPRPPAAVEEIFKVVEHMPRFPGCEHLASEEEKKACSREELLNFIYHNLEYPAEALEQGLEGTSVISFIIEKNGSVGNVEIVRDPGAGMGAAAAAAVEEQNKQGVRWTGYRSRGRPVRVQMNIPVHFRLTKERLEEAIRGEEKGGS